MVKWNDLCNESEAFKSNLNFELRDQKHFFESKGFKACRNIVEINFHFANPIVVNKKKTFVHSTEFVGKECQWWRTFRHMRNKKKVTLNYKIYLFPT